METLKKVSRRLVMTCLFCVAFFTTFQTFSGVSAAELHEWMYEKMYEERNEQEVNVVKDAGYKRSSILKKLLPTYKTKELSMSHDVVESAPVSLEKAIDWSRYPRYNVIATGYTAGVESTGKNPGHPSYGITYSGVQVRRDLYSTIAADTSVYPIGTVLFIPGYGYGVVADTGSAIKGNKIDLYYESVQDVYEQWGKQEIEVYLVKKGNGKLSDEKLKALNENEAVQVFREQMSF